MTSNELRAIRATRDHVLTDFLLVAHAARKQGFPHAVP
jgi:hypothetical protein